MSNLNPSPNHPKNNNSVASYIFQAFIAIVVVVIGFIIADMFFSDKVVTKRGQRIDNGILVEVQAMQKTDHDVLLEATGEVIASRSMSLKSEANGRVTWVNPNYYPGAHFKKGDVIARIAQEDYEIKLNTAKIQLRLKESALLMEEAKGRAATAELNALKGSVLKSELTEEETSLVRRVPQLQDAIANVELAKNTLKQAQLDHDRSIVRMPYDAVLQDTTISIGDYISGSTSLGNIVASDVFWIKVSLQPSLVSWLGATEDALKQVEASVRYEMGGKQITRKARVLSMLSSVESLGRMVQVVLAVDDPFGEPVDSPLLIGTFIHATLKAPNKLNSIEVPRAMVREGNQVYVCSKENTLEIRDIVTPYKNEKNVYVTEGLNDGDRVVTTLISSPIQGRKLRVKGETSEVGQVSDDTGRGRGGGPRM